MEPRTMYAALRTLSRSDLHILVIILLLGVAMSGPAIGQQPESQKRPPELAIEQIKKSVVFISGSYVQNGEQKTSSGTGFFIFTPEPRLGQNRGLVWLVTAKHVLQQKMPDGNPGPYLEEVAVRVNTKEPVAPDGRKYAESKIKVKDQDGNLLWFVDRDDENVDLAFIRVSPDEEKIEARWIQIGMFVTESTLKELHVNENDEVLFTGLFPWYPGRKKNYPIVRHGHLALLPEERIPINRRRPDLTAELYLVEITSFGGNSGSPVFLRIGGIRERPGGPAQMGGYRYFLLGVMSGFFSEASEFAIEVREIRGVTAQNSGIAAVVPANNILKLLDSPEVKADVDVTVERILKARQKQGQ